LFHPEATEAEMLAAARLDALVKQTLNEDGLGPWIEATAAAASGSEAPA
jgi:hypothetical protein